LKHGLIAFLASKNGLWKSLPNRYNHWIIFFLVFSYAKSVVRLQRVLDIFWMVHNFVRSHFTTREVPAVALGIIEKGLTWEDLLQIRLIS
jgi:hypothetical protein